MGAVEARRPVIPGPRVQERIHRAAVAVRFVQHLAERVRRTPGNAPPESLRQAGLQRVVIGRARKLIQKDVAKARVGPDEIVREHGIGGGIAILRVDRQEFPAQSHGVDVAPPDQVPLHVPHVRNVGQQGAANLLLDAQAVVVNRRALTVPGQRVDGAGGREQARAHIGLNIGDRAVVTGGSEHGRRVR